MRNYILILVNDYIIIAHFEDDLQNIEVDLANLLLITFYKIFIS